MKRILVSFLVLSNTLIISAQTRKVLFIGNSYTAVNNLPLMIANIATSMGDTLQYDSNTPGGYTFNLHSTNVTTLNKIAAQDWDYVVLQAQSQEPSFPPAQVESNTYPYADTLVRKVLENDSCTRVLFYMTWGRKNGDAANCASYPVICTYEGMQARLRSSYLEMAQLNEQEVAPVGAVWKKIRESDSTLELYQADESHPEVTGTYVAACTFYCSLFHKPLNSSVFVPAGVTTTQASLIQQTANEIVFDSLSVWMIDTVNQHAVFDVDYDSIGYIHFYALMPGNEIYNWVINGINYSGDDVYLPLTSDFDATLTSLRNCEWETMNQILHLESVMNNPLRNLFIYPNPADQFVLFSESISGTILIHDVAGKIIATHNLQETRQIDISNLQKGTYLLTIDSTNGNRTYVITK